MDGLDLGIRERFMALHPDHSDPDSLGLVCQAVELIDASPGPRTLGAMCEISVLLARRINESVLSIPSQRRAVREVLDRIPYGNVGSILSISLNHALDVASVYDDLLVQLRRIEGDDGLFARHFIEQSFRTRMFAAAASDVGTSLGEVMALVGGGCLEEVTEVWKQQQQQQTLDPSGLSHFWNDGNGRREAAVWIAPQGWMAVRSPTALTMPARRDPHDPNQTLHDTFHTYTGLPPGVLGTHMVPLLFPESSSSYPVRVVAAGGSVLGAVQTWLGEDGKSGVTAVNDVDIYLMVHDLCPRDDRKRLALSTIVYLVSLLDTLLDLTDASPALIMRTTQAVTVTLCVRDRDAPLQLQFNVRLFHDEEQLLTSFDLDPCCFSFDGTTCQATRCASWSVRNHMAVINPLQASCPSRLQKYATKGFTLICYLSPVTLLRVLGLSNAMGLESMHAPVWAACLGQGWNVCQIALVLMHLYRSCQCVGARTDPFLSDLSFAKARMTEVGDGRMSFAEWEGRLTRGVERVTSMGHTMIVAYAAIHHTHTTTPLHALITRAVLSLHGLVTEPEGEGGFRIRDPTRERRTSITDAFYSLPRAVCDELEKSCV